MQTGHRTDTLSRAVRIPISRGRLTPHTRGRGGNVSTVEDPALQRSAARLYVRLAEGLGHFRPSRVLASGGQARSQGPTHLFSLMRLAAPSVDNQQLACHASRWLGAYHQHSRETIPIPLPRDQPSASAPCAAEFVYVFSGHQMRLPVRTASNSTRVGNA